MTSEDIKRDYECLERGYKNVMNKMFIIESKPITKSQHRFKSEDTILTLKEESMKAFINILKEYIQKIKGGCKDTFDNNDYKVCIDNFASSIFNLGNVEFEEIVNVDEFKSFMELFANSISIEMMKTYSYDVVKEMLEKSFI